MTQELFLKVGSDRVFLSVACNNYGYFITVLINTETIVPDILITNQNNRAWP